MKTVAGLAVENAMWGWGNCGRLWQAYEYGHKALCSGAMPSLFAAWSSLFVAAIATLLGGFVSDFATRQALQRQRDSNEMTRSLYVMLGQISRFPF